jgi:hypothetical protein
LQPAVLANSLVGRRVTTLSDDSHLTELALADQSPQELVDAFFARVLSRPPSAAESELFVGLLREGYEDRRTSAERVVKRPVRHAVSWSNHLSPEATKIKLELEHAALEGDPPTARLTADWRERAEDMIWSLVNSPEFVFVP